MARTGVPAYDSGMRGKEAPAKRGKPEKKSKRPVKRISIERANTGHIVEVERHQPKQKGNQPMPYETNERHAHSDGEAAKNHVNSLIDEMTDGSEEY